jgi:archaellin
VPYVMVMVMCIAGLATVPGINMAWYIVQKSWAAVRREIATATSNVQVVVNRGELRIASLGKNDHLHCKHQARYINPATKQRHDESSLQ